MYGGFTESYGLSTPGHVKEVTNFGIETPSKRRKTASSVPSASSSISTGLRFCDYSLVPRPTLQRGEGLAKLLT